MAMMGLPKSSSFMPVARQRPRAPAILRPWVEVLERYWGIVRLRRRGRRVDRADGMEYCAVDTHRDRLRQFGDVNPSDFFISLSRRQCPARWFFTSGHYSRAPEQGWGKLRDSYSSGSSRACLWFIYVPSFRQPGRPPGGRSMQRKFHYRHAATLQPGYYLLSVRPCQDGKAGSLFFEREGGTLKETEVQFKEPGSCFSASARPRLSARARKMEQVSTIQNLEPHGPPIRRS